MKKSQIKILHTDNKIVIKKNLTVVDLVAHTVTIAISIAIPFISTDWWDEPWFWICYVIGAFFFNFSLLASTTLGKIVLCPNTKEICIYNLCKEKYTFDEITDIKIIYDSSDPEGGNLDDCKLVILLEDGHKAELYTSSKVQSEEIKEYIENCRKDTSQ